MLRRPLGCFNAIVVIITSSSESRVAVDPVVSVVQGEVVGGGGGYTLERPDTFVLD